MKHRGPKQPYIAEFPTLSRDVDGLWIDSGAELIQPVRRELFRKPKFGIVIPGLGRHAVSEFGFDSAVRKVALLAQELPQKRNFTVTNTIIDRSNGKYIVGLQTDPVTSVALSEERAHAQLALDSKLTNQFNAMAVASYREYEDATATAQTLDRYFSYIEGADALELGQPTLSIRT